LNTRERPTIHYTELAAAPPNSPLATEWETYRREVGRLIEAGHEGKWVLIKGEEIIGIFDTQEQALTVGSVRFLLQPKLIHRILTREPVLRYFPRYNWTTADSPLSIHYTQLPPAPPDSLFHAERELYRREVGRLIAEGHEGRWVLIKGEEIIGLFDTREQALDVRAERFFGQPVLVQQILTREPVLVITPGTPDHAPVHRRDRLQQHALAVRFPLDAAARHSIT
jgi:hypothetical protein